MTRVAVVAASPVLRAGLESLLAAAPALVVVGSVAEPRDREDAVPLIELVAPLAPDVVVWVTDGELATPLRQDDGVAEVARRWRDRGDDFAGPAVVVLSDLTDARAAIRMLRAGARAVLPREAGADEIVAAVEAVAAGLLAVPADLADELLAPTPPADAPSPTNGSMAPATSVLSTREREVLALLAQGLANKAIAPRLGISEHTVKAHVASIFAKLGVGTRAEAVVTAARLGILML